MKTDSVMLNLWCKAEGLELKTEHRFHPTRRWRFDYAIPSIMVALEVEGMVRGGKSRHTTIKGYRADCEKYNAAGVMGWCVLRYTQDVWQKGRQFTDLDAILKARRAQLPANNSPAKNVPLYVG